MAVWEYVSGASSTGSVTVNDIAVDSAGGMVIVGHFTGSVDFGTGSPITSQGSTDIFVLKLASNGAFGWLDIFGNSSSQSAYAVAVDSADNVLLTGSFQGTLSFGGGSLTSAGSDDIFVVKLAPSNGTHIWSKRFGDSSGQYVKDIAVDSKDNVLVAGYFYGTVDFGGGPLTNAGSGDIFVAKLDSDGVHVWSKRFGDSTRMQVASAIATDNMDNVLLAGDFRGSVDFGGGLLTSPGAPLGYLVKFASDGQHIWSRRISSIDATDSDNFTDIDAIAVDGAGRILVMGISSLDMDFGAGQLPEAEGRQYTAKFDPHGQHLWGRRFDPTSILGFNDIAAAWDGQVVLAGHLDGQVDFGGGPLFSVKARDGFVTKFDAGGEFVWQERLGEPNSLTSANQSAEACAVDGAGNVLAAGNFQGTISLDGTTVTSNGVQDLFAIKYLP